MTKTYHLTLYRDLIKTANFMYDSLFTSYRDACKNLSHARAYFIILHLAIEHLLKAGLIQNLKSHDLEELLEKFERDTETQIPKPISEKIKGLNSYGYPVDGSERYPLRGFKRLDLEHDLLEDWDYFEKIITSKK